MAEIRHNKVSLNASAGAGGKSALAVKFLHKKTDFPNILFIDDEKTNVSYNGSCCKYVNWRADVSA